MLQPLSNCPNWACALAAVTNCPLTALALTGPALALVMAAVTNWEGSLTALAFTGPALALVMAAVRVVFPWSTCPMVPMLR